MMHRHVDRYINLHRALGKGFANHEKSLREFAAFAADRSDHRVTASLILAWAGSAATPNSAQNRYDQARAFAMFLHAEDVQHEVPVAGLFGRSRRRRPAPHILSQNQINGILAEICRSTPASFRVRFSHGAQQIGTKEMAHTPNAQAVIVFAHRIKRLLMALN